MALLSFYYLPSQDALLKEHFSGIIKEPLPKVNDLVHAVDLVLLNTHPAIQFPRVHAPNSIECGGMHLRTQDDEIHPVSHVVELIESNFLWIYNSQEFTKIMDKAVNGIIYLSLGGDIKSSDLPMEKLEAFIKVFGSMIDVLVLWKFETIALKDRHSGNIIIGPWLPQQEILQHKNLKVFITQGGLLSLMEALHYGKPIIGIPFFNDHKLNMARAESQGYGLTIDYDALNEASLREAIETIFNDPSYQSSAEKHSAVVRDNAIAPIDKAVHYVEHVMRSNGAAHLKTAATKLSLSQIHLIDQIAFVLSLLVAATLIAVFVLSKIVLWTRLKFQKRSKLPVIKGSKRIKSKTN
jgi:glucuronosyltransferase